MKRRRRIRGGKNGDKLEKGTIRLTERQASVVEKDRHRVVTGNVDTKRFSGLAKGMKHLIQSPYFIRAGTTQDGSCFYHTLATVTNIDDYFNKSSEEQGKVGRAFRKTIHDKLSITREAWDHFWEKKRVSKELVPEIEEILTQMRNPSTWADVFAIMWICDLLDLNLMVFDMESNSMYCGTFDAKIERPTMLMAWIRHSHFEPILEFDPKKMRLRTLFSRRKEGRTIMDHLIRMYEKQGCPGVSLEQILRRRAARRRRKRRRR